MKTKIIILFFLLIIPIVSCKKDYLDNPSTVRPTADNYYNTPDEVYGATGVLYNGVWLDWSDKAFISVGDVLGGTVTGTAGNTQYNSFYNFNIQSTDGLIAQTWKSCYKAAGIAADLIHTLEEKKSKIGNKSFLTAGIAEAKFIRAFAYFYIARTFGDAPIVENPIDLTSEGNYNVPRYIQSDVLRFAAEDLKFAEENLPEPGSVFQKGRVHKYSAKGLLAKVYLYMKDYNNAKLKAKEVIDYATANPDKVGLYPDYNKMFTSSSANNNQESLFALQWLTSLSWDGANRYQLYVGPQPLLKPAPTNGNGYSAVVPSIDLLNPVTGYATGDKRRNWSVMEQGFTRPEWVNANFPNGFKYDTTAATDDYHIKTGTRSSILKYVVGPNRASESVNTNSHSSICTYILRYADVLLIYAEASMNGSGSTTDGSALAAYNAVHTRAGLPAVSSITINDILHERKVEFAFEGDYWFDIQRQGLAKAKSIIESQERGTYGDNRTLNSFKATIPASFSTMFLPIPQAETVSNPLLNEPAKPYYK
jgi:hypothetical protein